MESEIMSAGIIYPKDTDNDFDRVSFETGLKETFVDFSYYLNTGDRSKFKPFKKALSEWKTLAEEVKKDMGSENNGSEYPGD
jgi:hypothetical protein